MTCIDTCGSLGVNFKMAVENSDTITCNPATFDASSERYEIISESVRYTDTIVGSRGLTGTIHKIRNHLRRGTRVVFGQILMEVGPNELASWLPRILGNAPVGNVYAPGDTFDLSPFDIMMNREAGTVIYRNCGVNKALFRGRSSMGDDEAQVMQMTLDIIGFEEHSSTWPTPEPALPGTDRLYWLTGDGKLETDVPSDPTEYYFDAFNLMIDNNLMPYVRNHLHLTCLQSGGQEIRLQMPTPYTSTSHTNHYINAYDGQVTLDFRGTKNLGGASTLRTTFDMPNCVQTRRTPNTSGRQEIPLWLDFEAYRDGTTAPITITNVV